MEAAVSTLLSYLLIFVLRCVHTRSVLRISWDVRRGLASILLLAGQRVLMEREPPL